MNFGDKLGSAIFPVSCGGEAREFKDMSWLLRVWLALVYSFEIPTSRQWKTLGALFSSSDGEKRVNLGLDIFAAHDKLVASSG